MKKKNTIKMKETNTDTANIDIAQKNQEIITRMEKCIKDGIVFSMYKKGDPPILSDSNRVNIYPGVTWDQLEEIITIAEKRLASKSCENYLIKNKLVSTK